MTSMASRLALCLALSFALSACLEDPSLTGGLSAPPEILVDETTYAARKDGAFTIPAVPVEKVPEAYHRQSVPYQTDQTPGTVIIDPSNRFLYLVTGKNRAIRYGISVGRAGFEWHGEAIISNRRSWPTWTPPPEMIDRDPKLEKWKNGQPGGPSNPLGARALYLTTNGRDYGYRIHGTPDWWSIGRNASSGCIRMIHQDVIDLESRVINGARVIVLTKDGQMPKGLKVPPPAPRKPRPAEQKPEEVSSTETPVIPVAETDPTPTPAAVDGAAPDTPPAAVTDPIPAPPAVESVAPEATPTQPPCPVPLMNGTCPAP